MKFICIKDVVMSDGSIAFFCGQSYEFTMNSNGEICRFNKNCLHKFMTEGKDAWMNYFKISSEPS